MIVICENCGKETNKKPSKICSHVYCSMKCMGEARKNDPFYKDRLKNNGKRRIKNKIEARGNVIVLFTQKGQEIIIDKEDYNKIKDYTWKLNTNGYAITEVKKGLEKVKSIMLHRLINNTPEGMITDHINRNKLDNRKENLRTCTTSENAMNRKTNYKNETSKTKGVDYRKQDNMWRARICKNGNRINLGLFKTEEEAIKARLNAEKDIFAEFSIYNTLDRKEVINE